MRLRLAITALVVGMTVIAGASPSVGAPGGSDVRGPRCTDITDGAGFYDGSTVNLRITLAATSCRQVSYTLYVLDEDGDAVPLTTSSRRGDGVSTTLTYAVPVSDDDSTVCVFSTTSIGRKVFDRAPDVGCADLTIGDVAPGRAYR